jgi:hypothetical protein
MNTGVRHSDAIGKSCTGASEETAEVLGLGHGMFPGDGPVQGSKLANRNPVAAIE